MPENAGFEMFRDSNGMWQKSGGRRVRAVKFESSKDSVRVPQQPARRCPLCGIFTRTLYKFNGQVGCYRHLPRLYQSAGGWKPDLSAAEPYYGEVLEVTH